MWINRAVRVLASGLLAASVLALQPDQAAGARPIAPAPPLLPGAGTASGVGPCVETSMTGGTWGPSALSRCLSTVRSKSGAGSMSPATSLRDCVLGSPLGHLDLADTPLCRRGVDLPEPGAGGAEGAETSAPAPAAPPCLSGAIPGQACPSWASIYDDPSIPRGSDQLPTASVMDPRGARLFVAVDDQDAALDIDRWVVVAEDPATGDQRWASAYAGAPNAAGLRSIPLGMAVSPDGSRLFVTGISTGSDGAVTFSTVAYDSATGAQLWSADFEGPMRVSEGVAIVAAHDGSTVYATGATVLDAAGDLAYVTIAFDAASGAERWIRRYESPDNPGVDIPTGIAVAPDDSAVYVTGTVGGAGQPDTIDIGTIAYATGANGDAPGTQLWLHRYGDRLISEPAGIAVSPDGASVFVAGSSTTGPHLGYLTESLDAHSGTLRWQNWYLGTMDDNLGFGLAVSPDGSAVYVTGSSLHESGRFGAVTIAFDASSGTQRWTADRSDAQNEVGATAVGVSTDGAHVFVGGYGANGGAARGGVAQQTISYAAGTGSLEWIGDYQAQQGDADGTWGFLATNPSGPGVYAVGPLIHSFDPSASGDFYDTATVAYGLPTPSAPSATVATPATSPTTCRAVRDLPTPTADRYPQPENVPELDVSSLLTGVSAVDANDVWAGGFEVVVDNPTKPRQVPEVRPLLEHFDGESWTIVPSPDPGADVAVIADVSAASSSDVWAVGFTFSYLPSQTQSVVSDVRPLIEHYDGRAWTVVPGDPTALGAYLNGIDVIAPNDAWAVGGTDGPGPARTIREHWNGMQWQLVAGPSQESDTALSTVSGSSPTDVWAVGAGGFAQHWDGTSWSELPLEDPNGLLVGVTAVSPTDVWAAGGSDLEHWDGISWSSVQHAVAGSRLPLLLDVDGHSGSDVWLSGMDVNPLSHRFEPLVEHYDGHAWTEMPATPHGGDANLYVSVTAMPGPSSIAVGGSGFFTLQPASGRFVPRADESSLCVDVTPSAGTAPAGSQISFDVTVHNWGSGPVDVSLHDRFPAGANVASASTQSGPCTMDATSMTCDLGAIAPMHDVTITVTIAVGSAGAASNVAKVSAALSEAIGAATVTVEP